MDDPIRYIGFPGLNLHFVFNRVAFHIGPMPIYWYGLIIVTGLLLAFLYAWKNVKRFGITFDDLTDVALWSMIFAVISARLYFVLFYVDTDTGTNPYFSNPLEILDFRAGGLAIYGGIIGAFVTAFVVCYIKRQNPLPYFDLGALGFLIGQAVGRWGNFVNGEAYGALTAVPWRMSVDQQGLTYHPCFLYESLWCILGFVLLHFYSKSKFKKFNGEIFLMYGAWYGFGRFFIEGLRTDSLMIGLMKVSQMLAAIVFVAAVTILIVVRVRLHRKALDEIAYTPIYDDVAKDLEAGTEGAENPDPEGIPETEEAPETAENPAPESDGEGSPETEEPSGAQGIPETEESPENPDDASNEETDGENK